MFVIYFGTVTSAVTKKGEIIAAIYVEFVLVKSNENNMCIMNEAYDMKDIRTNTTQKHTAKDLLYNILHTRNLPNRLLRANIYS